MQSLCDKKDLAKEYGGLIKLELPYQNSRVFSQLAWLSVLLQYCSTLLDGRQKGVVLSIHLGSISQTKTVCTMQSVRRKEYHRPAYMWPPMYVYSAK